VFQGQLLNARPGFIDYSQKCRRVIHI
jgi:hypothetical protein